MTTPSQSEHAAGRLPPTRMIVRSLSSLGSDDVSVAFVKIQIVP